MFYEVKGYINHFFNEKKIEESENNGLSTLGLEIKNENLKIEINQVVSNYKENKNLLNADKPGYFTLSRIFFKSSIYSMTLTEVTQFIL